ncbi:MAG: penicillin acylase family protein, partial [Deltaproteobacteria bacterium]|nr:penicillin acylase family protein [Deltaproteobacteria bacterium]
MKSTKLSGTSRLFIVLLLSALMVFAVGCKKSKPVYKAEIRRTAGGIPHIKAKDFASLGFGTGYAAAEDNICLLAESILKHRGELSRYFGPGENNENLNSDFFYKLMIDRGLADQEIPPEFEALFRGYAAGYNRYIRDTGVDNISDPNCQYAEWMGEISVDDVKRINTMPFWLPNFHPLIVAATPPATGTASVRSKSTSLARATNAVQNLQMQFAALGNPYDKGSNGLALGRDATKSGKGMLLANPHMTWSGTGRFYPFHQTIPGVMNMLGATVLDRANVGFGTTEHVAWTNTVSPAQRYAFYMLQLDNANPTVYKMDNVPYDMITEEVTVSVLNPDGSLGEQTHTFYSTHFGFVVGGLFPWMPGMAFALRLADEGDRNLYAAIAKYQTESVRDLKEVHDKYQIDTTYTIAADSSGEVLFGDLGPLANMTDVPFWCFQGSVMVGSSSDCQWCDDPDAAAPGIYPPDQLPSLFRYDYVLNSNDSYWLTNPNEPLTGFNPSLGKVDTERTLRTRSAL